MIILKEDRQRRSSTHRKPKFSYENLDPRTAAIQLRAFNRIVDDRNFRGNARDCGIELKSQVRKVCGVVECVM